MNKRGQFYILAAVIIIAVIVGFGMVRNYVVTERQKSQVYDLGEELKIETGQVYDYGVYNPTIISTDSLINAWAGNYSVYSQGKSVGDWILVYGNQSELNSIIFSNNATAGTIGIELGGEKSTVTIQRGETTRRHKQNPDKQVNLTFENINYPLTLEEGENFFFVIKSGENVATG